MNLSYIAFFLLLPAGLLRAAETVLTDSEGQKAWLYSPSAAPLPGKTYWLAVGVHGAGGNGEGASGISSWAKEDVLVLGPSFVQPPRDPAAPDPEGIPLDSYQMAGPSHGAKLKALIEEVGKTWKLHPRVFLHGFSAGAQFVHRFAMKETNLIAGVSAASAGSWSTRGFGTINPAAAGIPFALSCGDQDRDKSGPGSPLSRVVWMKEFASELAKANFDVESRVIENSGHRQHEEGMLLAEECFARARGLNRSRTAMVALDFNGVDPLWGLVAAATEPVPGHSVTAVAQWQPEGGTVDQAGGSRGSGAAELTVSSLPGAVDWSGRLETGLLPIRCPEADVKLLTLAFDLEASAARPVEVTVESFDATRQRIGGLSGRVIPAAPGMMHRHTLDAGSLKPSGTGAFQPQAPFVRISLRLGSNLGWAAAAGHRLRLDNLSWVAPAWFVSPDGKDEPSRGTVADQPLATVQQAVDRAQSGDVIMVRGGTYERKSAVAHFKNAGQPAAWIVLRSWPGEQAVFRSAAWDCIRIGQGSKDYISPAAAPAWLELRDLTIQGDGAEVEKKYPDKIGKSEPETNGNGISVDGRFMTQKPHHLRIAGCTVFDLPGGGISVIHADRVSVENNHTHGNCHWMIYAGSGISIYQPFNFEARPEQTRILVRNNRSHDNYCTQPWVATGKISDGNGIIVDDTRNTQNQSPNSVYRGRLLIQGNVSYRNGGSGMHAFSSDGVDFVHNTAVGNNLNMDYAQIGITRCTDCRVLNNIMVAPEGKPVNRQNGNSSNILISHNLLWGGTGPALNGAHPLLADPQFVDAAAGDFRLKPGSPALRSGGAWEVAPVNYQDGTPRPAGTAPDLGAQPAAP